MAISTEKAYETLNLPLGAAKDAIEKSYKKLAIKWHPEKHLNSKNAYEAYKKFKGINVAYRKLILNERADKDMSLTEIFDQYSQVIKQKKNSNELNDLFKNSTETRNNSLPLLDNNSKLNNSKSNTNVTKNMAKLKLNNDTNNNDNGENYENQYMRIGQNIEQNSHLSKSNAKALAIKGNELAMQEKYQQAIDKFSEAIKYDPNDYRLFGNRSFCYDKINAFKEALKDAEKALCIEPSWAKGFYRKGRALSGLKIYKEADEAFQKVLDFDSTNDPELEEELFKVRASRLQEMGFTKAQSENAIKKFHTIQRALESLVTQKSDKTSGSCSDSDESDSEASILMDESSSSNNDLEHHKQNDKPANVLPCTSLWIGNVDPSIEENELVEMFSPHGHILNVRCLPDKYCAFINFKSIEDSSRAMQALQGRPLLGQKLLIKYPDNPNIASTNGSKNNSNNVNQKVDLSSKKPHITTIDISEVITKPTLFKPNQVQQQQQTSQQQQQQNNQNKLTGPVNGNECYFWRTTGCIYGDKCHYDHIKKNKGIDKKPWHK